MSTGRRSSAARYPAQWRNAWADSMVKAPPWIHRTGTSETSSVGTTRSVGVPAMVDVE